MSAATGLGLLDLAILEACEYAGAVAFTPFQMTARVLDVLFGRTGVGPRTAHEPLCDMVRPWVSHLRLIEFHGNYGSLDFGPANPRYTECRLTPLGQAALAAERGEVGPLPIGLINGNTHVDGIRPPLDPRRVLQALRSASAATDAELAAIVGLPAFPTGCQVTGDLDTFSAGGLADLTLTARLTWGVDAVVVSNLAPDATPSQIATAIAARVQTSHLDSEPDRSWQSPESLAAVPLIREVIDEAHGDVVRLVVRLTKGADRTVVRRFLEEIWGIRRTMTVALGRPIADLTRSVAEAFPSDLTERLVVLEQGFQAP